MFSSSNPTLSSDVFRKSRDTFSTESMTVNGTVNKCLMLLCVVFGAATWSWQETLKVLLAQSAGFAGSGIAMPTLVMGSAIAGMILALITIFVQKASPYTAPLYAVAEGVLLGGLSAVFEQRYPGIVFQAVLGTFGTFFFMLFLYRSNYVRATDAFKRGMMAALGGLFFVYLISMIMGFFGTRIPFIHESGPIGIGFSLVVVGIAAFSLILDFDQIEEGEHVRAPKYMEWYGAFALLVTMVWLYLEMLRLLSKFRDRR